MAAATPIRDTHPLVGSAGRDTWSGDRREPDLAFLRDAFHRGDFAALDVAFAAYQDAADRDPVAHGHWVSGALTRLATETWALQASVQWVEAAPSSFAAALFRGLVLVDRTWRERGSGWALPPGAPGLEVLRRLSALAEAELSRSLSLRPTSAAHEGLVMAATAVGDPEATMGRVGAAVAAFPKSFEVRRAAVAAAFPRYGGAPGQVDSVLAAAPASLNPRFVLLPGFVDLDACRQSLWEGRARTAKVRCERASALGPHWEFLAAEAEVEVEIGLNEYQRAIGLLDAALAERPQRPELHLLRARALSHRGKGLEAGRAMLQAVESSRYGPPLRHAVWIQNFVIGVLVHGPHLFERGPVEARERLLVAKKLDPRSPITLTAQGRIALLDDDRVGAENSFRESLRQPGDDRLTAAEPVVDLLISDGRSSEAAQLMDELLGSRDSPLLLFLRARAETGAGQSAAALETARQACEAGEKRACRYAQQLESPSEKKQSP